MIRKEKIEELKNIIEEYKTIKKEKIEKEEKDKFLKSEVYRYYLNDGTSIVRERLIKGGNDGSAAIIIPKLENGEILTIVEPRVHTELTVGIGFPAGYIENHELAKEGALRELQEETGYSSDYLIELDSFYQDEGVSSALNRIYLALDCKQVSNQNLDKEEKIKYMTFTKEEISELERLKYIMGVNTKLAIERLYSADLFINLKETNEEEISTEEKYKILKKIYEK